MNLIFNTIREFSRNNLLPQFGSSYPIKLAKAGFMYLIQIQWQIWSAKVKRSGGTERNGLSLLIFAKDRFA